MAVSCFCTVQTVFSRHFEDWSNTYLLVVMLRNINCYLPRKLNLVTGRPLRNLRVGVWDESNKSHTPLRAMVQVTHVQL